MSNVYAGNEWESLKIILNSRVILNLGMNFPLFSLASLCAFCVALCSNLIYSFI